MIHRMKDEIEIGRACGPRILLDPSSVLDLRSVHAGGVDWAPGRDIVDDGDARIFHSLQGFLFTAGPDHRGHPEPLPGGEGRYPLHGSFAANPARDIAVGADGASCRARVPLILADGSKAALHREWRIDEPGRVHLEDRLENTGMMSFPPMMLYHMNINTRLFGPQTRLSGAMLEEGGLFWDFGSEPVGVRCVPAQPTSAEDGFAEVRMGPVPGACGLTLVVRFETAGLPHLQFWRNRQPGIHVFGIEPCSHRLEKRPVLEAAGEMTPLAPGESRRFSLSFAFLPPYALAR